MWLCVRIPKEFIPVPAEAFKLGTPDEVAIQESINTRKGVERCVRFAFEYCRKRNKKKN